MINSDKLAKVRFSEKSEVEKYSTPKIKRVEFLIKRFLKPNSKILEVGCASGGICIPLAKKGFDVTGIDFSEKMIEKAKENKRKYKIKNLKLKLLDVRELKEKNKYDHVLGLFNLLTYTNKEEDRKKMLKNMITALKPKGVLIMDMANKYGNLKLLIKEILYAFYFFIKRIKFSFGDVYVKPRKGLKTILFQHYLSKNEIKKCLKEIPNIKYKFYDFSLFLQRKTKKDFIVVVKKIK